MDALGFRTLAPDTKPDAGEAWRQVLLDAADYIEAHGWCQGHGVVGSSVCAWIATEAAARQRTIGLSATREADQRFVQFIGMGADPHDIPRWNDAPGRTAAEVTAALRECARS